jgi:hypothetical protein
MTVFQFQAPPQVMGRERATAAEICPATAGIPAMVNVKVNEQIHIGIETNHFLHDVQVHMDNPDRFTAGMSDFLRRGDGS